MLRVADLSGLPVRLYPILKPWAIPVRRKYTRSRSGWPRRNCRHAVTISGVVMRRASNGTMGWCGAPLTKAVHFFSQCQSNTVGPAVGAPATQSVSTSGGISSKLYAPSTRKGSEDRIGEGVGLISSSSFIFLFIFVRGGGQIALGCTREGLSSQCCRCTNTN